MQPCDENASLLRCLRRILEKSELSALFQPIVDLQAGGIVGYEGLIRGPAGSPLHSPANLFRTARAHGLGAELETKCCAVLIARFAELELPGKLFLNLSPESLLQQGQMREEALGYLTQVGISPDRLIIELTEHQPTHDYKLLRDMVTRCRAHGLQIAIDDLGEGFSSLRLWSELRPEYVKIDMHFVHDIDRSPLKRQFLRSIQEIAREGGSIVIAEGLETAAEFAAVRDLGILHGQGYYISRPESIPARVVGEDLAKAMGGSMSPIPGPNHPQGRSETVSRLVSHAPQASPEMTNDQIYDMFSADAALQMIPVTSNDVPVGLIVRSDLIGRFARPYLRELFGKKPCTMLMDDKPLLVEKETSLQALSLTIVDAEKNYLSSGFIVTEQGRYLGVGTGQDLMRELTQMQITAARYANPLTQLPGNVPIQEHIERLLHDGARFAACYVDLDHFKAFNDIYGYRRGDDVIQLVGRLLTDHSHPALDFVGHIGGDDFLVLFRSADWEQRCHSLLQDFASAIPGYFSESDRRNGGYISEDRRGNQVFHPLISMSIGAVNIDPERANSHYQIASMAANAKREAKKIPGDSLFVERRQPA